MMRVRLMEKDPERLRQIAKDWGVKTLPGQAPGLVAVAIASAYRRELEAETRRAMREAKR
jgi:hypothetical protein